MVEAFFAAKAPVTSVGSYALAKALKADGRGEDAAKLARAIYRDSDLSVFLEGRLKTDFGADLTKADYKYRADRLIYKDQAARPCVSPCKLGLISWRSKRRAWLWRRQVRSTKPVSTGSSRPCLSPFEPTQA